MQLLINILKNYAMKAILSYLLIFFMLMSCRKEPLDPYALPWNTRYISYENINFMCGSHSTGFNIYYKDSLLMHDCIEYGGVRIVDSLCVNDSFLMLFKASSVGNSEVLYTKNGGITWHNIIAGPPDLLQLHYVSDELIYCITSNYNDIYITGIDKSDLSVYKTKLIAGTHYLSDFGTNISGIDSTIIAINDTVKFVVLFH